MTHNDRTPSLASCGALAVSSAGAREGSALAALLMRSAWLVECAGGEPLAEQKNMFYTSGIIPLPLRAVKFAFSAAIAYTGAGGLARR